MENWIEIPGFESEYSISDMGNVRSNRTRRPLSPYLVHEYLRVRLSSKEGQCQPAVHRIVLICFKGFDFKRQYGNHLNGIKTDNRLVNLEWTTCSENLLHASRELGVHKGSKLSVEQVTEIKGLLGSTSQSKISRIFGVSQMTISKIANGRSWISV